MVKWEQKGWQFEKGSEREGEDKMTGLEKGTKQEGCEQGTAQRQVPPRPPPPQAFGAAAEMQLRGEGLAALHQLPRALPSNAAGRGSLPGTANARFHRLRHPKNPTSPRSVCRGSDPCL